MRCLLYCYHYDPATGKIRRGDRADSEAFGNRDHPRARRDGMDLIPHRIRGRRARSGTGRIAMFDNFPLWPQQASAGAANVDALYVFLLLLSAFMCVAIFSLIVVFAVKYRRRPGVAAEQIEGSTLSRADLVGHSHVHLSCSFSPGARSFIFRSARLRGARPKSTWWPSNGCGSCSTRKGSARSMNCTCRWAAT